MLADPHTACARIDLAAYAGNLTRIADHVGPEVAVMAVVKADAYGHGMIECARVARAAGIPWVGVATVAEALTLREAGDQGPLFAWLYGPDEDLSPAVATGIDLAVHRVEQLSQVAAAAAICETTAAVQLKIDTGLSRNGATGEQWPALVEAALEAVELGALEVRGIWSHFAASDEPEHPATAAQLEVFEWALGYAADAGLAVPLRHIGNSAAALRLPQARYDLVRIGIAAYGIDPADGTLAADAGVELQPVMTLRAQLINVKPVPAGAAVSYGGTWTATESTVLGLVPLGYGDGVPRGAGNRGQVLVGGRLAPIRGRICMDQFVVDLGPDARDQVGDEVVLFGAAGAPTASDWARAGDTIGYEVVTRLPLRLTRIQVEPGEESR
ncbi:alanine racemase [Granulicoccus phenolivorans]|uniref:alanine racemase n=1 Tax=Granulicoccus phenolivorans TaxID=266854 RepID=UPI0004152B38|nr:alanine racemase [Granulicoccus phenolivorans]